MTWNHSESAGPWHEASLAPEFRDGERGIGISGGGVPVDQVIVEADYATDTYRTRPAAEVVGWRILCECSSSDGTHRERWAGSLFERVRTKALEDVEAGLLWAADADVIDIGDREDVNGMVLDLLYRDHVGRQPYALEAVETAAAAIGDATTDLDQAVIRARQAGVSWDAIGRAAGMTRQSAHTRWSKTVATDSVSRS